MDVLLWIVCIQTAAACSSHARKRFPSRTKCACTLEKPSKWLHSCFEKKSVYIFSWNCESEVVLLYNSNEHMTITME